MTNKSQIIEAKVSNKAQYTLQKLVSSPDMAEKAERALGERSRQFLTSVLALANSSPAIAECEPLTTYNACLTAATLDLPINQNLGFAYIVPFRNNTKNRMEAQFQIGYKGFIQLALRSGQFESLNVRVVKEDEIKGVDSMTGEPTFNLKLNATGKVAGYMAYFKLTNGFRKTAFMTIEELEAHAKKYSQSYRKGFGVWKDNFDAMAQKTVLKLLLSKYAPLSAEMITAIEEDQKSGDAYVDNSARYTIKVENAKVGGEDVESV